mgnify:CR=1 FL=1
MASDRYLTIKINQQVLASLIARRQLAAEQLRGMTPATQRALHRILLESLKHSGADEGAF